MTEKRKNVWAIVLLLIGVAFLFLGIYRGEMEVVWLKAANICLECIGIG